jgi:hypothetical protein
MDSPNWLTMIQNTDSLIHLYKINGGNNGKQNCEICVCYTKEYYPPMTVYSVGNWWMKEYAAWEE